MWEAAGSAGSWLWETGNLPCRTRLLVCVSLDISLCRDCISISISDHTLLATRFFMSDSRGLQNTEVSLLTDVALLPHLLPGRMGEI